MRGWGFALGVWVVAACAGRPASPVAHAEVDMDRDGIVDAEDPCPETRGVAGRGCPIHDDDPDVVAPVAATDACPGAPETVNGFKDDDGCPDEVPGPCCSALATARLEPVHFSRGVVMTAEERARLARTITVMTDFPSMRIEASGHTDSREGTDASGRTLLGLTRARVVQRHLVEVGKIAESRIDLRSAGADEPIDTNRTAAGRSKNRRVELTILVGSFPEIGRQ